VRSMKIPKNFLTLDLILEERQRVGDPNIVLFLNNTPIANYTHHTLEIKHNILSQIQKRIDEGWHINAIEHEFRIYQF